MNCPSNRFYQSKVYLSPRIPPDMIDLSSRIISDDHSGTMRNTKIYDAYPAYYRQKIHKASYGSELNRVLELVMPQVELSGQQLYNYLNNI